MRFGRISHLFDRLCCVSIVVLHSVLYIYIYISIVSFHAIIYLAQSVLLEAVIFKAVVCFLFVIRRTWRWPNTLHASSLPDTSSINKTKSAQSECTFHLLYSLCRFLSRFLSLCAFFHSLGLFLSPPKLWLCGTFPFVHLANIFYNQCCPRW